MWNIKYINSKKDYVIERLKHCSDSKEKEKLELSLTTYLALLDNSGALIYKVFYNIMDKIIQNSFSTKREQGNV